MDTGKPTQAADEANKMEAEKQDAPKRHLTPVKTPDHLPKKLHYTLQSRGKMSFKKEEIDKAIIKSSKVHPLHHESQNCLGEVQKGHTPRR